MVTLFFGAGWAALPPLMWFCLKLHCHRFFFFVRASLPRPRFAQLMAYGWKDDAATNPGNLLVTGAIVLAWES